MLTELTEVTISQYIYVNPIIMLDTWNLVLYVNHISIKLEKNSEGHVFLPEP